MPKKLKQKKIVPKRKRVAIIIPSGTMVHANFAISLASMVARVDNIEIAIVNPKSSLIAKSRNKGVESALALDPDYILFLDSDMMFPMDTLDKLMAANKDIVGCNYVMRNPPHTSLVVPLDRVETVASGVTEVEAMPTGLLLIKRCVFEKLPKPWFATPILDDGDILGEDYYFCKTAREAGFSIWLDCDLSLQIVHWGDVGFRWTAEGGYSLVEV